MNDTQNNYTHILFDLDGTLSDPKIGITRCIQYALQQCGIVEPDLDRLEPFIGPPLADSFREFYGMDDATIQDAIQFYRERFAVKGMYENTLFPAIPALLQDLIAHGKTLAVATSKPTVFAEQIVKHFEIDSFFVNIVGSNLDGTREAKAEVIDYAMGRFPATSKNNFLMIGDRKFDVLGAQANGIHSVGVTYGYGSVQELKLASPTYLATRVEDLKRIILPD